MTEYTLAEHVSGDSFLGLNFDLSNELGQIDITDAVIELTTDRDNSANKLSVAGGHIEITDGPGGLFGIKEQKIEWEPHQYTCLLRVQLVGGRKRTYAKITWPIV